MHKGFNLAVLHFGELGGQHHSEIARRHLTPNHRLKLRCPCPHPQR